jgi:hypothetical protein
MRAIDDRLGRQRGQPLHIGEHLFGIALEQPATAHGEQGVAGEHHRVGRRNGR